MKTAQARHKEHLLYGFPHIDVIEQARMLQDANLHSHGVIYGAGLEVNHGVSQRVGHEVGYEVGHSRQGVHLDPSDIPGKCWGCHKF